MGQHKHNLIAIAAKNGELPPKKKRMAKWQREALLQRILCRAMLRWLDDFVGGADHVE